MNFPYAALSAALAMTTKCAKSPAAAVSRVGMSVAALEFRIGVSK